MALPKYRIKDHREREHENDKRPARREDKKFSRPHGGPAARAQRELDELEEAPPIGWKVRY